MHVAVSTLLVFLLCAGPAGLAGAAELPLKIIRELEDVGCRQVVWIWPEQNEGCRAVMAAWESTPQGWVPAMAPVPANIGRNGLAAPEGKREGDGCSPHGVFPLTLTFGREAAIDSRMPYRQVNASDVWVDDPAAPDYNTWTTLDQTKAKSFEKLLRTDKLYDQVIVVGYNTNPIEPGLGSAIFLHLWSGPGSGTAGCGAFAPENMARLLQWLDPEKEPHVIFMPRPAFF